jgi:serine/threonine protein kinase/formylglycine-generating enzyme required for sulfatase activity
MNATAIPTLNEGQKLAGCYTLKRGLSSHDDCPVWLAQDEVLGKDVTLHFVPQAILRDQRAVAELRQEVKRNRQLIHPNILRVYDYVEDTGAAAISMDKFDGEALGSRLEERGALEPQEIQPWIAQLAETLSDAHRIQLIHRDLAPDNVVVRSSGSILLTSFGIARSTRDAMERAGLAKGAAAHLAYMSPQQIDGERPVAADDVYGLGVLIFELLTGRPPFTGDDLVPQIRKAAPPAINSIRAELGLSPVAPAWQSVVEACLAKNPAQRPRSCGEVVALIAQAKSAPVAAPATSAATQPIPSRPDVRESAAPSRSAPAETPAKTPVESAPAKDSPVISSSAKSSLPPSPPSGITKKAAAPGLSSNYPDLDRPKSRTTAVLVGLAAVVLGAGVIIRYLPDDSKDNPDVPGVGAGARVVGDPGRGAGADAVVPDKDPETGTPGSPSQGGNNATADNNPGSSSAGAGETPGDNTPTAQAPGSQPAPPAAKPPAPKPIIIGADPKASEVKTPAKPEPTAAAEKPEKPKTPAADSALVPLPQAPAPLPKLVIPTNATLPQLEQLMAERQAAADKLADTAKAAETAQKENAKRRDEKQAEIDQSKKANAEKRKSLAQAIQTGASVETDTAKMKDAMEKAKAAAVEAVKAADSAEKAFNDFTSQSGEKLAAKEKAQKELGDLALQDVDRSRAIDEINAQVTKADSLRTQMALMLRQIEQDKTALNNQLAKARAAEAEVMRKANREKVAALEVQLKPLEAEASRFKSALAGLKDLGAAGVEASKPLQQQLDAVNVKISALHDEIKALNGPTVPEGKPGRNKPGASATPPTPPTATTTNVTAAAELVISANPPTPQPLPTNPAAGNSASTNPPTIAAASAPSPGETEPSPAPADHGPNSLGMKFATVGNVQFAIYPTTRQQFEAFAKATNLKNNSWQNPWFEQGPDHPVVNITWREADAFCKWLTDKERKTGQLKAGESYRLPSDLEWSKAVGLGEEKGSTPEERDMGVQNVYPWGTQWPPPAGSGNYAGEETKGENPIQGYNDGYENTSPVGKFKVNAAGLYDMSGNVWQWVADDWNAEKRGKTLRGGSWYNGAIQLSLLSSCRIGSSPDNQNDTYGFRIVRANDGKGRH